MRTNVAVVFAARAALRSGRMSSPSVGSWSPATSLRRFSTSAPPAAAPAVDAAPVTPETELKRLEALAADASVSKEKLAEEMSSSWDAVVKTDPNLRKALDSLAKSTCFISSLFYNFVIL